MPKRKRTFKRKTQGRRNVRRKFLRARRRKRRYSVRLMRGPVATTTMAKLAYVQSSTFTPAAGLTTTRLFRCNDLYDPDFTGAGHQPMGFDEIIARYNHFTVVAANIHVKFIGGSVLYLAGIHLSGNTTVVVPGEELQERGRTKYQLVAPNGSRQAVIRYKFNAKRFFNVKSIVGESLYRGNSSSSPTENAFFHVFGGSHDGATTIGTIHYTARIEYIAVFTEPKQIGQS